MEGNSAANVRFRDTKNPSAVRRAGSCLDRNSAFPGFSPYQSSFLGSKIVVIRVFFLWEMRGFALFYRVNSAFV